MPKGIYDRQARIEPEAVEVSNRAQETRRARRQRSDGDLDGTARLKLAIPAEIKEIAEREGKTIRWINDDGNRMHFMFNRDWDVIEHPLAVPEPVGTTVDGKPIYARMAWKYQDWYDEDQRAKAKDLKDRERAVEGGKVSAIDPAADTSPNTYVPEGNRISIGG